VAGLIGLGPFQAGRDLLLRLAPRIGSHPIQYANESALEAALRIAPKLTGGVLPVQGPPGSGKTFTGARMICELIRAGKRVGITANSHKVIRNLLDEVLRPSDENGMNIRCIQKVQEAEPDKHGITFTSNNADIFNELKLACCVAAGTPWL
jgi:hypothetical protein